MGEMGIFSEMTVITDRMKEIMTDAMSQLKTFTSRQLLNP